MHNVCCVRGCGNRRGNVKLHRLPSNKKRLLIWLKCLCDSELRKLTLVELSKLLVCHDHFEKRFVTQTKHLRANAYPTLFTDEEIATGKPRRHYEEFEKKNPKDLEHNYTRKKHYDHTYFKLEKASESEDETFKLPKAEDKNQISVEKQLIHIDDILQSTYGLENGVSDVAAADQGPLLPFEELMLPTGKVSLCGNEFEDEASEEYLLPDETASQSDDDANSIREEVEASEIANKEVRYLQVCRCCLSEEGLEDLWSVHSYEDMDEVYGSLLKRCFGIELSQMKDDKVCSECIRSLHEANAFKNVVLNVQQQLTDAGFAGAIINNSFIEEFKNKIQDEISDEEIMEVNEHPAECFMPDLEPGGGEVVVESSEHPITTVADDDLLTTDAPTLVDVGPSTIGGFSEKKADQLLNDKQVGTKDVANTAIHDKVSRDPEKFTRADRLRLEQDVKMILACTNVTPYSILREKFLCAYCNEIFDVPDELRSHVLTHDDVRGDVDLLLRPAEAKEIMRLDIQDLKCIVCDLSLRWENLWSHLEEHGVLIAELSKTRIVPFELIPYNYKCVFCDVCESRYMKLEVHMSVHFDNYICGDCGHSFMIYSKLKTHEYQEKLNKLEFKCEKCEETIMGQTNFEKHIATAHSSRITFPCKHCKRKFKDQYRRHLHMVEKHKNKVKPVKCEECDKEFLWKGFYLQHYRRVHLSEQKYECALCKKSFFATHTYKRHLLKHRRRPFQCVECQKLFVNKYTYRRHSCNNLPIEKVQVMRTY